MSGFVLLVCIAAAVGATYLAFRLFIWLPRRFRSRKWLFFIAKLFTLIGLALTAYISLVTIWFSLATYYPHRDFDKTAWLRDVDQRYTMVDDLSEKAVGWDKQRVIATLGLPDAGQEDTSFRYATGDPPQVFGGADPFEIVVEFQNGKVTRCYILET